MPPPTIAFVFNCPYLLSLSTILLLSIPSSSAFLPHVIIFLSLHFPSSSTLPVSLPLFSPFIMSFHSYIFFHPPLPPYTFFPPFSSYHSLPLPPSLHYAVIPSLKLGPSPPSSLLSLPLFITKARLLRP